MVIAAFVGLHTGISSADAEENLANAHTGYRSVGLAKCSTHASLQSIRSCAGQHFVDADDMEGVSSDTQMEAFFARGLDEIPVERELVKSC